MKALKIIVVLTIIGSVSGGLLAWVYAKANPLILEDKRRSLKQAVIDVLPGVKKIVRRRRGDSTIYDGSGDDGALIGHAFAVEGAGFQGKIKMMLGVDPDFKKIVGLKILENVETPGLGNRIGEKMFQSQFLGLRPDREIVLLKYQAPDPARNQVEAVTGATISSRAVVAGLNHDIADFRKIWAGRR